MILRRVVLPMRLCPMTNRPFRALLDGGGNLLDGTVYRILGSAEIFLQHGPYGFRSCQLIF